MIDPFSVAAVPLELMCRGEVFSSASGFVWRASNSHYLITNWHVVSGCNSETGELLDNGRRPDVLRGYFNIRVGDFQRQDVDIPVRTANDTPRWYVHPTSDRAVDLVAIPIPVLVDQPAYNPYPINGLSTEAVQLAIGMDVFVLGYPFGVKPPYFPIWKRGSIASEPDLVRITDGRLLIDTASRPGMSGSAVIRRRWNTAQLGPAQIEGRAITTLIGVYSGRLWTRNSSDAQIGIVWPTYHIDAIINGRKIDE
jgi:hypothetical protein